MKASTLSSVLVGILVGMLSIVVHADMNGETRAIGEAWSRDGSELFYREYHYAEDDDFDMPTRVLYLRENGELFAEKSIDYRVSATAPAISFTDFRSGTHISAEHGSGRDPGYIRVAFTADADSDTQNRNMQLADRLIIDAGFDVFIREHWDTLTDGNRMTAPFLVPSRMDTVRVGITGSDTADCSALNNSPLHTEDTIACFTVRPAGILRVVGWLTEPIRLAYSQDSQRLLMFDGVSNIPDDDGEGRHVVLVYTYPSD
jgi:hypothetical protein